MHPSSEETSPEGNTVLPTTLAVKELKNVKRYKQCKVLPPKVLVAGLRPKPPPKKMQLWKPDDETFAFICKRMKEDEWVSSTHEWHQIKMMFGGDTATRITYTCLHSV